MSKMLGSIRKTTWNDVRNRLEGTNPDITALIDQLNPDKKFELFTATYPFGSCIVENGTLMVPNSHGQIVPIHHPDVDADLKQKLSYSPIPLCIWLNTAGEVFVNMDNRVIPLNVFTPGSMFGLWEILDPPNSPFAQRIWNISVGARSLFMLPKVTDAICHDRLMRAFQLRRIPPPKNLSDHYKVFVEIANSSQSNINWQSDVLIFSGKWFEEQQDNIAWLRLQHFLLKTAWRQSLYWRNKVTFRLMEQAFANAQEAKNLKASPSLINTVMHLIMIGMGSSPGFAPSVNDETVGPISAIQQAYIDHYGLKSYIPTIMRPQYLCPESANDPIYYSLQMPTVLGSAPKPKSQHSIVDDQRILKFLLEALESKLHSDNTSLYQLIKNLNFYFFHIEEDTRNAIHSTREMPKTDPRLLQPIVNSKNKTFCETSPFLRGCLRISAKKSTQNQGRRQ